MVVFRYGRTLLTMPRFQSPAAHWLGIVAILFLAIFLIYPLGAVLSRGKWGADIFTVLADPYLLGRVGFTAGQALLSTAVTVVAGFPLAVLFARFDFVGKRLWRSALTIPFVLPTVVAGTGFLALIGARGILGLDLRNTLLILILAHLFYNVALVVRIVGSYLESVAPSLNEAASLLGSGSRRMFLRITLPVAAPALLSASALVFILTFTSFGVILFLTPAPTFATIEVEIYRQTAQLLNLETASSLALVQLAVVALVARVYTLAQARLSVTLNPSRARLQRASGTDLWWIRTALAISLLLVFAPILAVIGRAFWPVGTPSPNLSGFLTLLDGPRTIGFTSPWAGLLNSLRFAALGASISLAIGFAFAYSIVRGGWTWLDSFSLLPLGVSAVTLGFGFLLAFPKLATGFWGIPIAHALIGFPFVTRCLLPALRSLPPDLFGAAQLLGASPLAIFRRIELPLLAPSSVTAASFGFAVSLGEFGASLVLSRPEFATLPVAIFDRLSRPGTSNYAAGMALALMLMLLTGGVMLLLERFGRSEI
jgi:thiamine transport system permease protein